MLDRFLEIKTLSVVVVGDMNPIIIQPYWLSSKGLIRVTEAEDAKIDVIHNEIVKYQIADWANIEITKEKFSISTSNEAMFLTMRDLAISIFSILKETPLRALGINHHLHYALQSEEKYFQIGNILAPLQNWKSFLKDPRLATIEILDKERHDGHSGFLRIFVQSSDQLDSLSTQFGLMIRVNNHFSLVESGKDFNAVFKSRMTENWNDSFLIVDSITNGLSKLFF